MPAPYIQIMKKDGARGMLMPVELDSEGKPMPRGFRFMHVPTPTHRDYSKKRPWQEAWERIEKRRKEEEAANETPSIP